MANATAAILFIENVLPCNCDSKTLNQIFLKGDELYTDITNKSTCSSFSQYLSSGDKENSIVQCQH